LAGAQATAVARASAQAATIGERRVAMVGIIGSRRG
jgi:hypothetical protein